MSDFDCCLNGEHNDPKPWLNPTTGERRAYSIWEGFEYAPRPECDWCLTREQPVSIAGKCGERLCPTCIPVHLELWGAGE